jgi:hypothetical protein
MAEKKKPKPEPSTGGKVTSRIKRPKGTQPLTLGTGGLRTGKVSKKQMSETRKVAATAATLAIPAAKAAKVVSGAVSRIAAKKTAPGVSKVINRTYTQGKDNVGMIPPKKSGAGAYSPVKGTKVNTQRQTRPQTPLQKTTTTTGAKAREKTKKVVTFAKGGASVGYTVDRFNQAQKKKAKKK